MIPNNILQQVATYAEENLAFLENLNCYISNLNTKFKDFNKLTANLGDTVNIELPTRSMVANGLVAAFAPVQQYLQPLVCDQAANSSNAFTDQQFIFNAEEYMEKFGKSRMLELAAQIEANVALNATSSVPVYTVNDQAESVPTGALHTESGPFRFYGDGITPINSFTQLAEMEALFRNFGSAPGPLDVYLDDITPVNIVGSGLNQFVPTRNEELAMSWDLGTYKGSNARYFKSNLQPIHTAGTLGNDGTTLTLVSTNDPTGNNVTQLTFSGAGTDSEAVFANDMAQFLDGVDGQPDIRYLTWIGHKRSQNRVQFRVTANAASSGGNVTVTITPALRWQPGLNQNLSTALAAGMQVKFLPSHRAGIVVGGNAFYLAMPALPTVSPFISKTVTDPDTGVSLRNYYGTLFGKNQSGYINDCLWASTAVPQYTMRIVTPVN